MRRFILPVFIICLIVAVVVFLLRNSLGIFAGETAQIIFSPVQRIIVQVSTNSGSSIEKLKQENLSLKTQVAKLQQIMSDNQALRDQFQTTQDNPSLASSNLLPSRIVGMPGLLPGVNAPEEIIVDKGKKDGVSVGAEVIYKDNLLGQVSFANDHFSKIMLVTNPKTSFTAKTLETQAPGILRGQGNGQIIFGNVLLSDSLKTGDTVVSGPNANENSSGIFPGLVIGKISSIEKTPSNLFQTADIQTLVNISKLSLVFILSKK